MEDRELEQLGVISAVAALNDEIQSWISERGAEVPADLLRQLSDLDWVVRSGYDRTRKTAVRHLRRREEPRPRLFGSISVEQARLAWERVFGRGPRREEPERSPRAEALRVADGWVWCEDHGAIHADTTHPYEDGEDCQDTAHRDVYYDSRDLFGA